MYIGKCLFAQESIDFIGCRISGDGILPNPDNVSAIRNFVQPADFASLRRFLGMANYYRRFLPHFAEIAAPLQDLITQYQAEPKKCSFTDTATAAFLALKEAVADAILLQYKDPSNSQYQLVTDAAGIAVGAALR